MDGYRESQFDGRRNGFAKAPTAHCVVTVGKVRFCLTAGLRALANFSFRPFPEAYDVVLVFDPDQGADENGEKQKLLSLLVDNGDHRKEAEGSERTSG
jgi:hypothetical protein